MTANNGNNGKQISLRKTQAGRMFRKLRIEPQSIIAFSQGTITEKGVDDLAAAINEMGVKGVIILVVEDVNQMRALNETEMNKLGWFHIDSLKNIVARKNVNANTGNPSDMSGDSGEPSGPIQPPPGN